jgi:hypothetical protein
VHNSIHDNNGIVITVNNTEGKMFGKNPADAWHDFRIEQWIYLYLQNGILN